MQSDDSQSTSSTSSASSQQLPTDRRLDRAIQSNHPSEAIRELLFLLSAPHQIENQSKFYGQLFSHFPALTNTDFLQLLDRLPGFLNRTAHLHENQYQLALHMGRHSQKAAQYLNAVDYFAKAIKIGKYLKRDDMSNEAIAFASNVFVDIINNKFLTSAAFKDLFEMSRRKGDLLNLGDY